MSKLGRPKSIATAWAVLSTIGDLATRLSSGHKALRKMRPSPPIFEALTVGSFVVGGMAMALSAIEEAVVLLEEVAPCVNGIHARYKADFDEWRRFRDDAAHIVDRTFRRSVSGRNDHDSSIIDPQFGSGTLVVGYDAASDLLVTGTHALKLGEAVQQALNVYGCVSQIVNEETHKGNIPSPTGAIGTP